MVSDLENEYVEDIVSEVVTVEEGFNAVSVEQQVEDILQRIRPLIRTVVMG